MASSVITNPSLVALNGPRVDVVNYQYYSNIDPAITAHKIMGNELSLSTTEANTFKLDSKLTVGQTAGFSNIGIQFNDQRTVAGNVWFHRAILKLMDFSATGYFQTTMLSGSEGTASPASFPCFLFTAACTNYKGGRAENMYGLTVNLATAVADLKLAGLTEGNSTDVGNTNIPWMFNGQPYSPNWVGRNSLNRGSIATYLIAQAALIGLTFHYQAFAGYGDARPYFADPSYAAVETNGVYNPSTGYNSAPVFNDTKINSAAANSCAFPCSSYDNWDMYSFGYLFTANPVPGVVEEYNSAWYAGGVNPADYYNSSMDYATNKILYATTVASAVSGMGAAGLIQMQNLPWINVYFENTIWVVLSSGWTGYANIPTLGPNSGPGLYFTLLNLAQTCFPLTCKTGGTVNYGLEANVDVPGGLTPMAYYNSVYDADVTNQIYESPMLVGPTQFTQPGALTNWMVTSTSVANFAGSVGPGHSGGVFIMQNLTDAAPHGVTPTMAQLQKAVSIPAGQVITLTLAKNIYFSDHVPVTAYDYNYSLYASDIASPFTLNGEESIYSGGLAGAAGLIATKVVNSQTIQIYMGSRAVWNLAYVQVAVVPQHIFKYLNVKAGLTTSATMDLTFPFSKMSTSNGCTGCKNPGPYPAWLTALPNLEVGTGPFMLRAWTGTPQASQHGQLLRNPTYFRAAWNDNVTNNKVKYGSKFTFKASVYEWTYSTTKCASSPDKICKVPIASGVKANLYLVNSAGTVLKTFTLTCNAKGVCSGTIPTTGFAHSSAGTADELAFKATYTYLGLARTWYQLTGVQVHN